MSDSTCPNDRPAERRAPRSWSGAFAETLRSAATLPHTRLPVSRAAMSADTLGFTRASSVSSACARVRAAAGRSGGCTLRVRVRYARDATSEVLAAKTVMSAPARPRAAPP
jgi:hypothetical protein